MTFSLNKVGCTVYHFTSCFENCIHLYYDAREYSCVVLTGSSMLLLVTFKVIKVD